MARVIKKTEEQVWVERNLVHLRNYKENSGVLSELGQGW